MSERDQSTATIDRDLGAIEEALSAGVAGHGDPAARELQELALAASRLARAGSRVRP
jgi:hypothetical protein